MLYTENVGSELSFSTKYAEIFSQELILMADMYDVAAIQEEQKKKENEFEALFDNVYARQAAERERIEAEVLAEVTKKSLGKGTLGEKELKEIDDKINALYKKYGEVGSITSITGDTYYGAKRRAKSEGMDRRSFGKAKS